MKLSHYITELKKQTAASEQRFADTFDYFLQHIAENPLAQQKSRPYKKNHPYKQMVNALLNHHNLKAHVTQLLLMQIKKHHLLHGSGFLSNHKLLALYYFTDIDVGMVILSDFSGQNDYYRCHGFKINKANITIAPANNLSKTKH